MGDTFDRKKVGIVTVVIVMFLPLYVVLHISKGEDLSNLQSVEPRLLRIQVKWATKLHLLYWFLET